MKKILVLVVLASCFSVLFGLFIGMGINFYSILDTNQELRNTMKACLNFNPVFPLKQSVRMDMLILETIDSDDDRAKAELYKALYQKVNQASASIELLIESDMTEVEVAELKELNEEIKYKLDKLTNELD